jgi:hypothetical protein
MKSFGFLVSQTKDHFVSFINGIRGVLRIWRAFGDVGCVESFLYILRDNGISVVLSQIVFDGGKIFRDGGKHVGGVFRVVFVQDDVPFGINV